VSRRARELPARAYPWSDLDPDRRNSLLILGGIGLIVFFALALIVYGYYTERVLPDRESVLQVGGRSFSYDYLERRARAQVRTGAMSTDPQQLAAGIIDLMATLEKEELTRLAARAEGITLTNEELEERIKVKLRLAPDVSREDYAARLQRELIATEFSLAEYREIAAAEALERKLRTHFEEQVPARADHVYLLVIHLETQAKALEARDRIRAGEIFGVVAAEMSVDESRSDGGEVGWVPRGANDPKIEAAVFGFTGVTDIIETPKGFYILESRGTETRDVDDTSKNMITSYRIDAVKDEVRKATKVTPKLTTEHVQRLTRALGQGRV
jgi:hypothetical protein